MVRDLFFTSRCFALTAGSSRLKEAAKRAFDALGGKPIPKVAQLSEQYAALLAEKQEQYAEYKALRQDMIAYRTAKQNVDKILGLVPEEQDQNREQKPER